MARTTTNPEPITVSAVGELLQAVLEAAAPGRIRVVGEVSNFSNRSHWFFSLKDDNATLRCVCFASNARKLDVKLEDGMEVIATGRLDFYPAQGHVQLYVDRIELAGLGELERRFRELCDALKREGYFDESRKRPLPALPEHVAIVTSETGAAIGDFLRTARSRWAGCRFSLVDVRVQGAGAAPEVARAVRWLSRSHEQLGLDAIVLTRGGGGIEDLWAFNDRIVADAIHDCAVPIVVGIGHERDVTIAELVADVRASTPTQAAVRLLPDREALSDQLDQLKRRITTATDRMLRYQRDRLKAIARHPVLRRPEAAVHLHRDRLHARRDRLQQAMAQRHAEAKHEVSQARAAMAHLAIAPRLRHARESQAAITQRLNRATSDAVHRRRDRLNALQRQLDAVGPKRVLQRGYTYTTTADGQLIRSTHDVAPGQRIKTVLHDGEFTSRVDGADAPLEPPPSKPTKTRRKRRRRGDDNDTPSLFE